jgi:hypothetical protein
MASARLHFRESCDTVDCLLAIRMIEESLSMRSPCFISPTLGHEMHDMANGAENFAHYLELLAKQFAPPKDCMLHEE